MAANILEKKQSQMIGSEKYFVKNLFFYLEVSIKNYKIKETFQVIGASYTGI